MSAFISIHALLAESDRSARPETRRPCAISIHALLAESDPHEKLMKTDTGISIHALLAESDRYWSCVFVVGRAFLSTLSLRRATLGLPAGQPITPDFYPRSPCGERRQ